MKTVSQLDLRKYVRSLVNELPSYEFDALMNQIAYLDHYGSIKLRKSYIHHIDEVISRAVKREKCEMLYSRTFRFSGTVHTIDLVLIQDVFLLRSRLYFENGKYRVVINVFCQREQAEELLVDWLSEKIAPRRSAQLH